MEVAQLIIYCVYLVMVIDNSYRLIVSYSMLVHNVLPPFRCKHFAAESIFCRVSHLHPSSVVTLQVALQRSGNRPNKSKLNPP